ncbi:zinc metalloprotease HtpX [Candidatus Parcubacteria bacterium]|nr:MAG: zinc metalloprotease HtpX [Candidatus Parcubacteria bacterium]
MASLYDHKESNIRRTWALFTGFLILVIGLGFAFSYVFQSRAILAFAILFSVITSFIGYWSSDKIALAISGARPTEKKENPYLWNIVENLSITAGLPMPKLYITPEKQINAFATGRNPENAVIAVTQGALEKLENEELEGVLAHELSHVGNRDILVSTVAVVLAGVISMLADFFLRSMLWGGRSRDNRGAGGILIVLGIALAILAPLGAMLMRLAISRKREFLADASGSLLTRYPEGLARALEKIGRDAAPMRAAHDSTAHLWISNPFKGKGFHKLFMTHPPLEDRVKALRGMSL